MKANAPQSKKMYRSNERVTKILKLNSAKSTLKDASSQRHKSYELKKEAPPIELFQKEGCPNSHAVRNYLSSLGVDFIARNISEHNDLKHHQLVLAGGKDQIPFMVDHRTGVKLYESNAIISYLEKEYGKPASNRAMKLLQSLELRVRAQAEKIQWSVKTPVETLQSFKQEARELFASTSEILKATVAGMKMAFSEQNRKNDFESSEHAAEAEYAEKFARKNSSRSRQTLSA